MNNDLSKKYCDEMMRYYNMQKKNTPPCSSHKNTSPSSDSVKPAMAEINDAAPSYTEEAEISSAAPQYTEEAEISSTAPQYTEEAKISYPAPRYAEEAEAIPQLTQEQSEEDAIHNRYPEPDISQFTEPYRSISDTLQENGSYGRLRITATSGNRASPIEDVLITVTRAGTEPPELLAVLLTDSNGTTQTLEISAPSETLSETPSDEKVSATVDITAYKKGYFEVLNRNVAVFSGITSIQPVNMVPLPLNSPPMKSVFTERSPNL